MDIKEFDDIRPYIDVEIPAAMERIAANPLLDEIAKYLLPDGNHGQFKNILLSCRTTDDFQNRVMAFVVNKILSDTSKGLTYGGLSNFDGGQKFLIITNHRDIVLDSAIINIILHNHNIQTTEIAVGDNLITSDFIEDIARTNKMIKVVRSTSPREVYTSSQKLSKYIRYNVASQKSSLWIAQRNGRTKDGLDFTEQGLLKMLEMSGSGDFVKDFSELNILPASISYEYEPCDLLKAVELYVSKRRKYVKSANEDALQYKRSLHSKMQPLLNRLEKYTNILKEKDDNLSSEDVKEGLTLIVSCKHPDPQFEGQTKTKLGNSEVRKIASSIFGDGLERFLLENPNQARIILDKAMVAAKASMTQAILPLRGKILNVEKARLDRALGNEEIRTIITAFGTGIGEEFDLSKLRYDKIIIMTDADVDGSHIRVLLLTLFYRFFRPIVEAGHVYAAQPPLYRITHGKTRKYVLDDKERDEYLATLSPNTKYEITRMKGLGEMDAKELSETTMDIHKRVLRQINVDDMVQADQVFSQLMGEEVEPRRDFIEANAKFAEMIDV